MLKSITLLTSGLVFGYAMQLSKVHIPQLIYAQMQMNSFLMLKLFLTATTTSLLSFAILERFSSTPAPRSPQKDALGFGFLNGYGANLLGGLLTGIGMTISGACPGTNLVQLGSQVPNSIYTYFGQLTGGFLFGWFYDDFKNFFGEKFKKKSKSVLGDEYFGVSYLTAAGLCILLCTGLVSFLEWSTPYKNEIAKFIQTQNTMSPITTGIILGSLQIVLLSLVNQPLGNSSQYIYILSLFSKKAYFLSNANKGQAIMGLGIVIGAFLSADGSFVPVFSSPGWSFFGGMMLMVGARLAGGCPSGHGLTGMGRLAFSSVVTVFGMFFGGFLTTLVY